MSATFLFALSALLSGIIVEKAKLWEQLMPDSMNVFISTSQAALILSLCLSMKASPPHLLSAEVLILG